MTFKNILQKFRTESFTEKEKGTKFERLIKRWFETDPRYSDKLISVWMWNDFPGRKDFGGKDIGIDLVAKTDLGDYWAIQCKCYADDATIQKPAVDSFIATASRTFTDSETLQTAHFNNLIWVATTSHWGANAEETLKNQTVPVTRINQYELEASPVDWELLLKGNTGKVALQEGKQPMAHQLKAMQKAHEYYSNHERGKMIMACGTGKTYTSLKIIEQETVGKGLILYMVPSIALLGQGLNNWMTDTKFRMKAVCICSDPKASERSYDEDETSIIDNPLPASTNISTIRKQLISYQNIDGLVVVFSTYQSIDAIAEAQESVLKATNGRYGIFDFIVCDEAHRTTGLKQKGRDESDFTKIHNNDFIKGNKRLYMTATPRYYNASAKATAKEKDLLLWSMDNQEYFGDEFYRIGFGESVANGLLTDYKVLVLTVSEDDIPDSIKTDIKDKENKELNFDDTTKLIGCINGLSKRIQGDNGVTKTADPLLMHRAVAFCSTINPSTRGGGISSTGFAYLFPEISKKYKESLPEEQRKEVVDVTVRHIDGTMNAAVRADAIEWLKADTDNPNECRILSNVRCLSEGVDVPALDAVIFVASRDSQVDVVQSVGRVMRSFHKGQTDEKKYGYIIVPVVVPANADVTKIMEDNDRFKVVWDILNALRAHDDQFNATVNKIQLNKVRPPKVVVGSVPQGSAMMNGKDWMENPDEAGAVEQPTNEEIAKQLELKFGALQDGIYAKMVEKVGDRLYWENWANKVGVIAQKFIMRIASLVQSGEHKNAFDEFVKGLQENLNPSVDEGQAIEMLAQHMITRPVFDALFKDYKFVDNNAVSRSMQKMLDLLENEAMDKDTEVLKDFYDNVRMNVGDIDNLEGKQTLIKTLYEKFFRGAFPKTVEKLGIVYTPVECVDFILRSVDYVLDKEFDCCLSDENVHILDPFVGTGTFITRLMQSGLIRHEDIERKYLNEIHCNEIVLLAYYIADVNIESVFHEITHRKQYLPYDGICLTDTFQTTEHADPLLDKTWFPENSESVEKQRKAPIRVIIGNPPYSIGQKSANDNAQNQSYPILDKRITDTYVAESAAGLNKSSYDAYIKAFRWASDKISQNKEGGVIGFISNGAWLDGNSADGFRKCLEKEFDSIYVFNLRGNCRTQGELRRKEGDGIFGLGSRTPIAITILVKKGVE
jgi:predicted helicase